MNSTNKELQAFANYTIFSVFIMLFLTIFYAFSGMAAGDEIPVLAVIRTFFVISFLFLFLMNISIFQVADTNESLTLKLIFIFFLYQIGEILFTSSPFSAITKYFFFFLAILIITFTDYSEITYKTKITNKLIIFLFIIIFGGYLLYMVTHPFSIIFRETRINFLFWDNNENAGFFATTFPFILFALRKRPVLRGIFVIFFFFVFIFYNGSRAAILFSLLILNIYYYLTSTKRNIFPFILGLIIIVSLVGMINLIGEDSVFSGKISDVLAGSTQEGNLSGRLGGIWYPVVKYVYNKNFLMGCGGNSWAEVSRKAGTFWVSSDGKNTAYIFRDAHNFFLVSFVEGGIINLLMILSFFTIGVRASIYAIRHSISIYYKKYSVTVFCSWIGLITWCMMYNAWYSGGWYFFTILFTLSLMLKNNSRVEQNKLWNQKKYHEIITVKEINNTSDVLVKQIIE